MIPLIDGDVLIYEVGFGIETYWKAKNEGKEPVWFLSNPPPFDLAENLLVNKINSICAVVEATDPPKIYLTGKGNFRFDVAKKTPYKERAGIKPYHYYNLKAYLQGAYNAIWQDGLEADDLMAIEQEVKGKQTPTIICTRDKDLRQVAGWHFGWELGKQPQFGPHEVVGYGDVFLRDDRKAISGYGTKFFLLQCLLGDKTDSIPGLPGTGAVGAFDIISNTTTYTEGLQAVLRAYTGFYGLDGWNELLEQGRLLWMTRKLNEDGSPVLWNIHEE